MTTTYALVKNGTVYEGHVMRDLLIQAEVILSPIGLIYKGERDTVSYSQGFDLEGYIKAATNRALELLKRDGWKLYKSVD